MGACRTATTRNQGEKEMARGMRLGIGVLSMMVVAGTAATSIAQEATLTADDYVEIEQLYARYNQAIDSGDAEAWAGTFTEDGTFGNSVGHDALVEFAQGFHENQEGHARHWNANLVITPTDEGADGRCYLMLYNTGVRPPSVIVPAIYEDKLVETADGWRFASRQVVPDAQAESDSGQ